MDKQSNLKKQAEELKVRLLTELNTSTPEQDQISIAKVQESKISTLNQEDDENTIKNREIKTGYKTKKVISDKQENVQFRNAPYILRVKRKRDEEALDEIYLEYDTTGNLKRTKYVTESEVIQRQLAQFKLKDSQPEITFKPNTADSVQQEFTLGKDKQKTVKNQEIKLKKLRLPQSQNKHNETQIRQFCQNLLDMKRVEKRQDIIQNKRNEGIQQDQKQEIVKEDLKDNEKDKILQMQPDLEIIDLGKLFGNSAKENSDIINDQGQDDDYVYEYFLYDNGEHIIPYNTYSLQSDRKAHEESDYDSQDSNREDLDQNDYPDEKSDGDLISDDETLKNKNYIMDEEEKAMIRYENKQLKNKLFDKILRKGKGYTYQTNLDCQMETGQLDDYEPDVADLSNDDDKCDEY